MNRRWLILGGGATIIVVVLIVIFTIISNKYKPQHTVDSFIQSVENNDTDSLKKIIVTDEKELEINKESLSAFIDYLQANNNSFQVVKDSLKKQIDTNDFTTTKEQVSLVEDGKEMGIFPKYKLNVKTANVILKGYEDEEEVSLSIKGSKNPLHKIDEKEFIFGPIFPGKYNIEATIDNKLETFKKEDKLDVWGNADVSFLIDIEKLARDNENVQNNLIDAANQFNNDFSAYIASGFDPSKIKNISDDLKDELLYIDMDMLDIIDNIESIDSKLLKSAVNMDEINLIHFDGEWKAEVIVFVSYDEKIKLKGSSSEVVDLSYTEVRSFSLEYDKKSGDWIVNDIIGEAADESVVDKWKDKKEIDNADPLNPNNSSKDQLL